MNRDLLKLRRLKQRCIVPSSPGKGDRAALKQWVSRLVNRRKVGWDQRANASAGPPIEALRMVGRRGLAAACPTLPAKSLHNAL